MKGFIFDKKPGLCRVTITGIIPGSTVGIFAKHDEHLFTGVVEKETVSIWAPKGTKRLMPNGDIDDETITVVVRKPGILEFRMHGISTNEDMVSIAVINAADRIISADYQNNKDKITVDWERNPRLITVNYGSEEITVQELHDTLSHISAEVENIKHPSLYNSAGGEDLGDGVKCGITMILKKAKLEGAIPVKGNLVVFQAIERPMHSHYLPGYYQQVYTS